MTGDDERAAHELLTLPFAPGEAPFRIKGVAYRGHVEYVDRYVPGGNRAVLDALGLPALTKFFAQPFLASERYDVFPLAIAGIGCGRVLGRSFLDFVRERASWQATEDTRGVYRLVLSAASPGALASRLPRLVAQYFDFGGVTVVAADAGHVEAVRTGIPRPLAEWYVAATEPYIATVLRLAGAKNVATIPGALTPENVTDHGVPLVRIAFRVEWGA